MEFFINIGIIGISFMLLGKMIMKNQKTQEFENLEYLNKLISFMESELVAKANLKYGKLLLICGVIGTLFYNTLGLFMVLVTIVVLAFYLGIIFINLYKCIKVMH